VLVLFHLRHDRPAKGCRADARTNDATRTPRQEYPGKPSPSKIPLVTTAELAYPICRNWTWACHGTVFPNLPHGVLKPICHRNKWGRDIKLTAQEIARYQPPPGKDHIVFDSDLSGFGLRYRNGKRTWIYQYAFGSGDDRVNARMTLGQYPALPATKARETAQDLYAKVRLGQHPAAEKKQSREAHHNTFGKLVDSYLESKRVEVRPRTHALIGLYLNQHAKALHGLPVTAIDRKRVAELLDDIAKNSGPVSSNRAHSAISALFTWTMRRGLTDSNPCIAAHKRKERSRDRVLADSELAVVWNALGDSDYADILRLLILTGQRAGEIGGLRWNEIDFDQNLISLPSRRTKNGQPHDIPLSEPVRHILKARPRTRDLVFGRGANGFNTWDRSKKTLNKKIAIPDWTVHDVRRSFATGLQKLGVRLEVTEAILNHVGGNRAGVGGIYRRYDWAQEKRTALDAWAAHVLGVVSGTAKKANVTPFRGRA
jgi:integrase